MAQQASPGQIAPSGEPGVQRAAGGSLLSWASRNARLLAPLLTLICMVIFFSIATDVFLTVPNMQNIVTQIAPIAVAATGVTFVLLCAEIDLSIASVATFTGVLAAWFWVGDTFALGNWGIPVAIIVSALIGLLNGFMTAYVGIPSFMMTLGMSSVAFGVTLLVSGGVPVYGLPSAFGEIFGFGRIAGLPVPSLIAAAVVIVIYVLLEWTRYGRHLYATGGNLRAAELSGVRTTRVTIGAFAIAGALSALSGLLLTARLDTGESNIGASMPLESIAACVIAGVSLAGGLGRTLKVVIGTLLIVLVQNGMNLMQIGAYAQTIAIGAILILAMALSRR